MPEAAPADSAGAAAARAARQSYGRLVALLAARSHDIAAAEDALSDALMAALQSWPRDGVPANPDAWLLTAARHRLYDEYRHQRVVEEGMQDLAVLQSEFAPEPQPFPDERLKLMLVCAHPALDAEVRAPLMLQTVFGLPAAQIAAAFLVSPATMAQRLVRAKARIKQTGMRFELPEPSDMPERLDDLLQAIYAAYGAAWEDLDTPSGHGDSAESSTPVAPSALAQQAIELARLLAQLAPTEPEPLGLLSLMLHCEARRHARRDSEGEFVPLHRQDPKRWNTALVIEAENRLIEASRMARMGRFQCEAAIQSVHAQRALTGDLPQYTQALQTLHEMIEQYFPSSGARVSHAAVLLQAGDATRALAMLETVDPAQRSRYQPYWVVRAEAQTLLGDIADARRAWDEAIRLTQDPAVARYLRRRANWAE